MGVIRRSAAAAIAVALGFAGAGARAETDLFGPGVVSGLVDVRVGGADGEASWLSRGMGKLDTGGANAGWDGKARLDLAALAWKPQLVGDLGAYVLAQARSGPAGSVDLGEAYLTYKPIPRSATSFSVRAGLMWPPVSLEHDGPGWSVSRTLTPSALNTWIAEEVKVVGVEATVVRTFGGHKLTLTAAGFGDNDTAGTLIAFRGWALDDVRTGAFGTLPLALTPAQQWHFWQADEARPTMKIDGRVGGYARLEWRPPAPVVLHAFYYDNLGNPYLDKNKQWGWRTRFGEAGLLARPAPGWEVLAQGLTGQTRLGDEWPMLTSDFSAAYVLATRTWDKQRATVRLDAFEVRQPSYKAPFDGDEHGWAATGDWAWQFNPRLGLWLEALHVQSDRPARAAIGDAPGQSQTQLQLAVRAKL